MKRLACVAAMMVVLGLAAALIVPWGRAPDADSILTAAAHAMDTADSVHLVGRPTPPLDDIPVVNFMLTPPGTGGFDIWLRDDCIYTLTYGSDGCVVKGYAVDASTDRWWFYCAEGNALYRADLSHLKPEAAAIIAKACELVRTGLVGDEFASALGATLEDVYRSASWESRDGRKVAVVTTTYTISEELPRVTGRLVVEVDAHTSRVLAIRQYIRAGDRPEKLLADIEHIEYNVPIPISEIEEAIPADGRLIEAAGAIEEIGPWLSLRIVDGDEVIVETDVPRD